ncbi:MULTISPECIES: cytochrome P450 [unclassified Crossiella]|uniref:cytochrome P450 n=1 Tax=unclassified Crossiella TaxID=2620835 RepID=UPI001FFEB521|nr:MULTISPECIES: cytochrome P450 [unclassified Crossiella]MCK2244645.1 cytochrome P450 [Crossiella sp. S99.2]MCK2258368.1 cytochrome P450 [Crossiella sp. S99.1]
MAERPYPFNNPESLALSAEYAEIRQCPGLTRVRLPYGEPAWLVTRHEEARAVLADPRFSRAEASRRDAPRTTPVSPIGIVAMDPPEHTRLRKLVAQAFTGRRAEALRPFVREQAEQAAQALRAHGGPADLVEHVALPVPIQVICELLGVPVADRDRFRAWSEVVLSTSGSTPAQFGQATGQLMAYMGELLTERRTAPAGDLISALAEAGADGERLSEVELVQLCIALLLGGYETTATELANFAHTLLSTPGAYARLCAEPETIAEAVEELLRLVAMPSAAAMPRYARTDLDIGGQHICRGEAVLVALSAANHDPARYPDPEHLDLNRPPRQHLAFGHGSHHCVGAALARVQLQETLRALTLNLPGLHLAGEVSWKPAAFLRGPRVLPVAW